MLHQSVFKQRIEYIVFHIRDEQGRPTDSNGDVLSFNLHLVQDIDIKIAFTIDKIVDIDIILDIILDTIIDLILDAKLDIIVDNIVDIILDVIVDIIVDIT